MSKINTINLSLMSNNPITNKKANLYKIKMSLTNKGYKIRKGHTINYRK